MKTADIIFIGAGPVGLFTAIQTKLLDPKLSIIMFEKYKEYQRKHPLLLNQSSFADAHPNSEFQKLIDSLPKSIRTNELETILLDFAKKLEIEIEYTHITDCAELAKKYSAPVIIGSDGAHSLVHQQIFNHEYQIQKTLQYICEIKYEVVGATRYLNKFSEGIPALTYCQHLVSEFVGKEKDNKTPVSIRIFIDEETYNSMKEATFKNPYNLSNSDKIVPELLTSIDSWLSARKEMAGEKRIESSERISVTNLPVYASKEFVQEKYDKKWFLVGDSAFGMPFFRSLNNGILCSSQLAKVINAIVNNRHLEKDSVSSSISISKQEQSPMDYYQNYVQRLMAHENFSAEVKNIGVSSLETSAHSLQKVPVSRAKLMKTSEGRNFKTRMHNNSQSSFSTSSLMMLGSSVSQNTDEKKEDQKISSNNCLIV